jgi:hypothetical protein
MPLPPAADENRVAAKVHIVPPIDMIKAFVYRIDQKQWPGTGQGPIFARRRAVSHLLPRLESGEFVYQIPELFISEFGLK